MGCDIHGFIEVQDKYDQESGTWNALIHVGQILGRNYDAFGILFGVRNYSNYTPHFADRGIPKYSDFQKKHGQSEWDDSRTDTQKEIEKYDSDGHSHSWFTWAEYKKIEPLLDEERVSGYITPYTVKDGKLEPEPMSFGWSSTLNEMSSRLKAILDKGEMVEYNGKHYKRETEKARDHLKGDWQLALDLMKRLAEAYGDDHVRMVVWFDN